MGECDRGRLALLGIFVLGACAGVDVRAGQTPPATDGSLAPMTTCVYGSFDCNPAVDDVIAQITALPERGDPLALARGVLTDLPTRAHHWQSVQRLAAPTGNYLVLSRSTSRADEADLAIAKLASRDGAGMRLHSNAVAIAPNVMAPSSTADQIIAETQLQTEHTHAGGMQLAGYVLAVPLEAGIPGSSVALFDMSDPTHPSPLGMVAHEVPDGRGASSEAGTASLARLDSGKFLLVVGRRDARVLDFYLSTTTDIRDTGWDYLDRWRAGELRTTIDDTNFGDYQNLQLVAGTDARLYLVGTHEEGVVFTSQWIDVYVLDGVSDMVLTKVAKRRVTCDGCNFDAGGGVYVDPTGDLIVYGVEYATVGDAVQAMEL